MTQASATLLRIMAWVLMAPAVCAAGDVPETYRHVARDHGIPSTLFYAVALAESASQVETRTRALEAAGERETR